MSNFQFGKSKVAKTAKSIRDDNEQGGAPLVPATPDNDQQQNVSSEEKIEVQKSVRSDCVTYVKSRIKFNTFNTFNNVDFITGFMDL